MNNFYSVFATNSTGGFKVYEGYNLLAALSHYSHCQQDNALKGFNVTLYAPNGSVFATTNTNANALA